MHRYHVDHPYYYNPPMPDGWAYEGSDPSVGIFGEAVWHEDCPGSTADDDPRDALVTTRGGVTTYTCPSCGDSFEVEEETP